MQAGPVFWISLCGLALIAAIIAGTALTVRDFRAREIQTAQNGLENTVRLLAQHFDRQITDFEAVERSVATDLGQIDSAERFRDLVSSEEFHRLLRNKVDDSGDAAGVNVYDADGNRLASSTRWPAAQVNLSDREYFQTFKRGGASGPVLVELVQGRLSQGLTIVVARKITGPVGQFLGMVTRGIPPDFIESFLSSVVLADGAIALLHRDGTLLARIPHSGQALGRRFADAPLLAEAASNGGLAAMQIASPLDGEERLASARHLERYPLNVVATVKLSAVLANWREQASLVLWGAAAATIVALSMLIFIVRYLRLQHRKLDVAIENMTQGLLLFDKSERLILCNRRYIDMLNLPPGTVLTGRSLREILQYRKETGSFLGDVDERCESIREGLRRGERSQRVTETPDGRWLQIVNQPLADGGWVSTLEDVTEQLRSEQQIVKLALYDSLTELPNRAYFLKHLRRQLDSCSTRKKAAVLFLDTDEFKSVNDSLGHHVGDELLKSIARALRGCLGPQDFLARIGGDEFAMVVPDLTAPEEELGTLVNRIYDALRQPHRCGTHTLTSDSSIGIAIAPGDGRTCEELLQNADLAMYEAKSSGRKTYRFFEPHIEKRVRERRALEADLRKAIESHEIEIHYQPILDLQSNDIVGCEALARWNHPERGYVSPADFIPVAEQSGMIDRLGEFVLRTACREAATWPDHVKVAVNVSPVQFRSSRLPLKVVSALADSGLSPRRLELEITEAVLIGDDATALKILHELRALGVRIALDDFGTGYSSLSYLSKFPFDKIKIDRAFINELAEEGRSAGIVRAVVALASEHRMSTTAEGVETEQQRSMLQQLRCNEMQGFLLSPARPADAIRHMLKPNQPGRAAS